MGCPLRTLIPELLEPVVALVDAWAAVALRDARGTGTPRLALQSLGGELTDLHEERFPNKPCVIAVSLVFIIGSWLEALKTTPLPQSVWKALQP